MPFSVQHSEQPNSAPVLHSTPTRCPNAASPYGLLKAPRLSWTSRLSSMFSWTLALLILSVFSNSSRAAVFHWDIPSGQQGIPDGDLNGAVFTNQVSGLDPAGIAHLKVFLDLEGNSTGFNGDFYVKLLNYDSGKSAILLNRVGSPENLGFGYGDNGFNVTLDDDAPNGDIHLYRQVVDPNFGTLTGTWAPDGRDVPPTSVSAATPRNALLAGFNGSNPNGTWALFVVDANGGGDGRLVSWGLDITTSSQTNVNEVNITGQPQGRTVILHTNATLSVSASSAAPLFYQWRFNGADVADATNSSLTLSNVQFAQAGTYSVVVSNATNSVTSQTAALVVFAALQTNPGNGGAIQRNPDQVGYPSNTVVQLTAVPNQGFEFTGWSGAVTGTNNPASVTMDDNRTVAATFTPIARRSVVTHVNGQGTIQVEPTQSNYADGANLTFTALPAAGYVFASWQGDLSGSSSPATLVVSGKDLAVTANFYPLLHPIPAQTVDEGTTLSFAVVTNPAPTLVFSLVPGAPSGAAINPTSAVFTWTPTAAQAPSTNLVSVRVVDTGPAALASTNSFIVVVRDVNTAPVLAPIGDKSVFAGATLAFTNTATDADLPAQTLTFSLAIPLAGATIDPTSGVFSWTPSLSQAGSTYTTAISVTDNANPPLSATRSFMITVNRPSTIKLSVQPFINGQFTLRVDGDAGLNYVIQSSNNLVDWVDLFNTNAVSSSFTWSDSSATTLHKFYRAKRP